MALIIYALGCIFTLVSVVVSIKVATRHSQHKELSHWIKTSKDQRTKRRPRNYKNQIELDRVSREEMD